MNTAAEAPIQEDRHYNSLNPDNNNKPKPLLDEMLLTILLGAISQDYRVITNQVTAGRVSLSPATKVPKVKVNLTATNHINQAGVAVGILSQSLIMRLSFAHRLI